MEAHVNATVELVVKRLKSHKTISLTFYYSALNDIRLMADGFETEIRKVHYNLPQHTDEFFIAVLKELGEFDEKE